MKILLYLSFILFSTASYSIEFYRCTDTYGKIHLTNMPKSSLDSNCRQKTDYHSVFLEEDYSNLAEEYKKYEITKKEEIDTELEIIAKPISDIIDSDKALEKLLDNANENKDSEATKLFKARTEAVESTLSEDKPTDRSSVDP